MTANMGTNSADWREQDTEVLPALPKAKIPRELEPITPSTLAENVEELGKEMQAQFRANSAPNFALNSREIEEEFSRQEIPNTEEIQAQLRANSEPNFALNSRKIEEKFPQQEIPNTEEITTVIRPHILINFEESDEHHSTNSEEISEARYQFDDEIEDQEDLDGNEYRGNSERKRGPYHVKATQVAERYQCSLEQIRLAVEDKQLPVNNQLALSNRTDKETTPLEEWKILTSSLEGWAPPPSPKKRGRRSKQEKALETVR